MKKENKTAIGYLVVLIIFGIIPAIFLTLKEWDMAEVICISTASTFVGLIITTKTPPPKNTSDMEKKNRDLINTTAMLGGFPPTIS